MERLWAGRKLAGRLWLLFGVKIKVQLGVQKQR